MSKSYAVLQKSGSDEFRGQGAQRLKALLSMLVRRAEVSVRWTEVPREWQGVYEV